MNFLDWFGNPENQGKIQSLIKFVGDYWPALTAAVLLFGTGFGGLVSGLLTSVAAFIPKMIAAVATMNPLLAIGLGAGALVLGAKVLDGDFNKDKETTEEEKTKNKEKVDTANKMGVLSMNKGGQVPGSGNTDTVPAMLTPGEFVMSKGAVQKYGANTMESMNAAAGGTNKPTYGDVPEMSMNQQIMKQIDYNEDGSMSVYQSTVEERHALFKKVGLPSMELWDGSVVPNFGKMGADSFMKGIQLTRSIMVENEADPAKIAELDNFVATNPYAKPEKLQSMINRVVPGSTEQVLGDLGDSITASAKMSGGGIVQGFQGGGIIQGFQGGGRVRGKSKMYNIKSREPKNTVIAYEQEANKEQQKSAPASGGNEIPSFDVAPIRDPLKMTTLQIVLF